MPTFRTMPIPSTTALLLRTTLFFSVNKLSALSHSLTLMLLQTLTRLKTRTTTQLLRRLAKLKPKTETITKPLTILSINETFWVRNLILHSYRYPLSATSTQSETLSKTPSTDSLVPRRFLNQAMILGSCPKYSWRTRLEPQIGHFFLCFSLYSTRASFGIFILR